MPTTLTSVRPAPALAAGAALTHPLAQLTTLAAGLAASAATAGEQGVSCVDLDGVQTGWTYRQLYRQALGAAALLRASGVAPGSRVVLRLADPRGFVLALWTCIVGGYVAIPTSDSGALPADPLALQQLVASLQLLEAGALIMADDQWQQARTAHAAVPDRLALLPIGALLAADAGADSVPVAGAPDRVALIFPTSGSSGTPKPVMQTEGAILAMCAGSAQMNEFGGHDVFLNWMPMEHVGSVVFLGLLPALVGARQVHIAHARVRRRVTGWLDLLTAYRASVAWVPNHVFNMVAKACARGGAGSQAWDLGALRFLVNAGESISPAFMRQFAGQLAAYGLREEAIRPAFGMSETCSGITWSAAPAVSGGRYVDLGAPIPGAAIRIVGGAGQLLAEGEVGTLHVKGDSVTRGYFRAGRDEKFLADGWFDTGDRGFIEAGRLYLTDREGDAIVIGGVAVHCYELEAAIENLDGVLAGHAAVCCVDEDGRATLAAYYCAETGQAALGLDERIEGILAQAAPAAAVRACALAPHQLPRTSIGKIQRKILRRRLQASLAALESQ